MSRNASGDLLAPREERLEAYLSGYVSLAHERKFKVHLTIRNAIEEAMQKKYFSLRILKYSFSTK
jgi:hypothetical protein